MKVLMAYIVAGVVLVVVLAELGVLQALESLWDEWNRAKGGRP